jgi:hypothetical protein
LNIEQLAAPQIPKKKSIKKQGTKTKQGTSQARNKEPISYVDSYILANCYINGKIDVKIYKVCHCRQ